MIHDVLEMRMPRFLPAACRRGGRVMYRAICLGSLAVVCCLSLGPVRSEKTIPIREVIKLQEALQNAVAQAEPSIACILVSRSPKYSDLGQGPSPDHPGRLGPFSLHLANKKAGPETRKLLPKLDLSNPNNVPESYGSGVVVDGKKGQILTNYHVVRGATKVFVRFPGGEGRYADIHAADPRSDLAVLQLLIDKDHPLNKPLAAIRLGDGSKVRKGQMVLSIANPYAAGFRDGSPSASWGIIANIRRRAPTTSRTEIASYRTLHHYGTLLQTDARLNLGCSGGALIDLNGDLIGLTSSLAAMAGSETPGGFAVPLDPWMRRIVDTLKEGKEVEYGFLGVSFKNPLVAEGIQLASVHPGSPADKAGLKMDDQILKVNGVEVHEVDDVFLPLAKFRPGDQVSLVVARKENLVKVEKPPIKATLAKYAVQGKVIAANRPEFRGLWVDYTSLLILPPLQPLDQGFFNYPRIPTGVLVAGVKPHSPAARVLKAGEVITHVNGKEVSTPADFNKEVKNLNDGVEMTLLNGNKVKIN
jgi:S1-C subfamily serine protease